MNREHRTSAATPAGRGTAPSPEFNTRGEAATPSAIRPLDRWMLTALQKGLCGAPVRLTLWDGTSSYSSSVPPVGSVLLKDRRTLLRLLWNRDVGFGEAFRSGSLEVHGDLVACLEAVTRAAQPGRLARRTERRWATGRQRHGLRDSRENIHHHYDLGNDFYRLWLDEQLVYTCAYFPSPAVTLEEAQAAKMHYVCRKLRLRAGEQVVEAGSGWGALALHMARHYGVSVRAFNISREQIGYARRRAQQEGLAHRVEFIEDDYRNVSGTFDAFVSVGMLEHVGLEHYPTLGEVIHRSLKPDHGRGLLHFIGRNWSRPLSAWIRKRIFPGAYPPTLRQVMGGVFESQDLSVLDVENLRLHYAKTLAHWLARFEEAEDRVSLMFDRPFFRTWRLYLAGSQAAFMAGALQLFQVTFARGRDNDIPWTRADVYCDPPTAPL